MKIVRLTLLLALLASPLARADDMQDAAAALEKKAYPEALRLYTKAAAAGNAQAQFQLGDLYFYGEGVAVDEKAAMAWFQKSAAQGNKDAAAALVRVEQRHARQADIGYWVSKYDGADLSQGRFACAAPAIPEVSSDNTEISKVSTDYSAWRDCHNGFIDNLAAQLPVGKQIPSDVEVLMTDDEMTRARVHLDEVYRKVSSTRVSAAAATVARYEAWNGKTTAVVRTTNEERQRKIEEQKLANLRDFARTDGGNPIGAKGATRNGGGR